MNNSKKVSGIVVNLTSGKAGNKNIMLSIKSEDAPLTVEMAKMLAGESASNASIIRLIQENAKPTFSSVWVSRKLVSHQIFGDSNHPLTKEDIVNKEFYCEYHDEGDMIGENKDQPVTKSGVLVNNDTVVVN